MRSLQEEIFDFAAKYKDEASYSFEHGLSQELENRLMEYSLRAADIVNCEGISRADLMVSNDGEVYFLEINTVPGMTSHSLVPMAAAEGSGDRSGDCAIAVELALSG
ncbi:MAG: hypothetical protein U5N86_01590 [Planctomycetota bacterium]|nr:hypothetical protein [Planctomycetota bacterium]